jgi:hypothetical protein
LLLPARPVALTKGKPVLIDCFECKARISDTAASCPQCGAVPVDSSHSLPVVVSDLDMKFSTIFWFLIKAAFAAVPAVIVLYTASTVIGGVLGPLLHL